MLIHNKFLVFLLSIFSIYAFVLSIDKLSHKNIEGYPGIIIHEPVRFEDQEITEIMFGKDLEHDEPIINLEDRCPTPPTPDLNK